MRTVNGEHEDKKKTRTQEVGSLWHFQTSATQLDTPRRASRATRDRPVRLAVGVQSGRRERTCCPWPRATNSRCCSFAAWRAACTRRPRCRWRRRPTGPRKSARACSWARSSARTARTIAPSAAMKRSASRPITRTSPSTTTSTRSAAPRKPPPWSPASRPRTASAPVVSPNYPVMVRALTRCNGCGSSPAASTPSAKRPSGPGNRANWSSSSRTSIASTPAIPVDRGWRMDLLDAYSYMPRSIAADSRPRRRSSTEC